MKRYDAWSEPDPQCGYGGARCELYERTLGQYVTFDDHEKEVAVLHEFIRRIDYFLAEGNIHMVSDAFEAIEACRNVLFQYRHMTGKKMWACGDILYGDTGAPEGPL